MPTAWDICKRAANNTSWDDCICEIDYLQSSATSLASCDDFFAIGMGSGAIKLYQHTTCEEIASIDHGAYVLRLRFDSASRYLASACDGHLKMWTTDGRLLWSVAYHCPLVTMAFTDADKTLMCVNKRSNILAFNTEDGTRRQGGEGQETHQFLNKGSWKIKSADICPETELLAIAYATGPMQIWSIHQGILIKSCVMGQDKAEGFHKAMEVLFNPNTAIKLVAVTNESDKLAIFDIWAKGENEVKSVSVVTERLASTSDGRTLVTGDGWGEIKLWDFEKLSLLYSINSGECGVPSLCFSGDGFRLYGCQNAKTKVWEPSVLVRRTVAGSFSICESVAPPSCP